jgi:hypothetical protein
MSAPDFSLSGVLPAWCFGYTISLKTLNINVDSSDETSPDFEPTLTGISADRVPISEQTDPQLLQVYPNATHKFMTATYHSGILPGMQVVDQDGVTYQVIIDQAPGGAAYNRIIVKQNP